MPATSTKFVARAGTQLDLFSTALQRSQPTGQPVSPTAVEHRTARVPASSKLGTFDGVFVPVCLSIWGVLAFLRFPWIIGQAGLVGTLALFSIGYFLTSTTTLSLSAISSNGHVGGGGAYFLISRVLGPEFGGSIGVVFWMGTILTGTMNLLGFVEPLLASFGQESGMVAQVLPEGTSWQLLYASCAALVCLALCLVGSSVVARASVFLAAILLISTLSCMGSLAFQHPFEQPDLYIVFEGFNRETLLANLWPHFTTDLGVNQSFRTVFSIVFPACTGILAGASMSGDLRAPSRAIPKGTVAALIFTYAAYISLAVLIAGSINRLTLLKDLNVLQDVSIVPALVAVGVASTSFFSALGSLLGAAKLFQAIIADDLLPLSAFIQSVLSKGKFSQIWGVLISYALMQSILVAVSDINEIAPFVTMCSLLTFGVLNLACLLLRASGSPNFRPTFEFFSWRTAFAGFTGCLVAMFVVDNIHALYSCVFGGSVFVIIHYAAPPKSWGDVTQSLIYHQCRKYLLRLDLRKEHVKFWRPQIMVLVQDPRRDFVLIQFLNDLKKGGLFVLSHILKGRDFSSRLSDYKRQLPSWLRYVDIAKVKAFVQLTIAPSERVGAQNLLLGGGLGGMKPNIIAIGFLERDRRAPNFMDSDNDSMLAADRTGGVATSYRRSNSRPSPAEQVSELNRDPLTADLPNSVDLDDGMDETEYVGIIEDALALDKAVAIARGFGNLEEPGMKKPHPERARRSKNRFTTYAAEEYKRFSIFFSNRFSQHIDMHLPDDEDSPFLPTPDLEPGQPEETSAPSCRYIDLWPIQMAQTGLAKSAYTFDSYTLVLQLGTILHMVPHWKKHYVLRTVVFVENEEEAEEEMGRVDVLLRGLRIKCELKMVWLRPRYGPSASEDYEKICRRLHLQNRPPSITKNATPGPSQKRNDSSDDDDDQSPSSERRPSSFVTTRLSREYVHGFDVSSDVPHPRPRGNSTTNSSTTSSSGRNGSRRIMSRVFDMLPTSTQHLVLNQLLQAHSSLDTTAVIMMTLPAPSTGTGGSRQRSAQYLEELDVLTKDLPPTFMVHGKGLTVTMSL